VSTAIDAGCVRLRLACAAGRVTRVAVASERPAVACLLRGKTAAEAVGLVPLLFAVCGQAQGRAAALALAAARGDETLEHVDSMIRREALREHLWRWLLDLPPLLGEAARREEFRAACLCIADDRRAELAALLSAPGIADLCVRLAATDEAAGPPPRLLPRLDAQGSLGCWPRLAADFCRTPTWQGAAAETGALARRAGRARAPAGSGAFASRWLARLDELTDWAAGRDVAGGIGSASATCVAGGIGRALVETARGLLIHEIVLDGERIADYSIVAPTEWNFHPDGPLAAWLTGRDAGDPEALRAFAARAVAALDPCVRWELEPA
jgi:hypothetical protein